MEKIRPFLDFVVKHKFWISCGLMGIATVLVWFLASNSLWNVQEQNTRTLDSKIVELEKVLTTTAEGLDSVKAHPNDFSKKGMEEKINEARESMLKAWKMRRAAQEPIMQWPESVLKSPEFVKFFSKFDPPEAFINLPQNQIDTFLSMYTLKIPTRMNDICSIIGTTWQHDQSKASDRPAAGNGSGTPKASVSSDATGNKDIVKWNSKNQELWNAKLRTFQGLDGNVLAYATAYQAFALQQDLWLLEAMFKVIKEVNGDVDANDLAAVREIDHIAFGRDGFAQLGTLTSPDTRLADKNSPVGASATENKSSAASSGAPSQDRAKGNEFSFQSGPAATGSPGSTAGGPAFDKEPPAELVQLGPFHGRYVNANFEPISIKDVYEALKDSQAGLPTANLELMVAKRVPVRIALKMTETKIPSFIAACANSPFGFEISQVRIGRHKANEGIELNGGAKKQSGSGERDTPTMAAGGGAGQGGSGLDGGGDSGSSGSSGATGPIKAETRTNLIVDVEFYGIVKIYNPVKPERLNNVDPDAAPVVNSTASAPTPPKSGNP